MAETGDISGAGVAGTATGNSGGNSVLNLTNREQEILSKAIMCLKSPPDVSISPPPPISSSTSLQPIPFGYGLVSTFFFSC